MRSYIAPRSGNFAYISGQLSLYAHAQAVNDNPSLKAEIDRLYDLGALVVMPTNSMPDDKFGRPIEKYKSFSASRKGQAGRWGLRKEMTSKSLNAFVLDMPGYPIDINAITNPVVKHTGTAEELVEFLKNLSSPAPEVADGASI